LPWTDRLYAAVLRTALWPLMNTATGRSIHRKMRFLEESQWWPLERLQEYQLAKLQRLMHHVYDRVPFYGREMRRRGLRPDDFTSLDALRQMPVVTKAMLQENPHDFLAAGFRFEDLITGSTSGSTGQPTRFYRTREQDSWHWALKYRMWGMAGYRLGQPYVNIYNMTRDLAAKRLQDLLLRNHAFYIFAEADQAALLDRVVAALARPEVRFLAGCTSTIRILADHYAARGLAPPPQLQAILCTGSLLLPSERRFIESQLGAPMWDHYGLGGEGIHVAAECEQKHGYHINVENLVIEPQDRQAVTSGEAVGALVTALDNFAWPLIRYETGDAVVFTHRPCPCGRGLPLLSRIDGRIVDTLALSSGVRLNEHYFSVLFGDLADVAQYQVEQVREDTLTIRLVWCSTPSTAVKQHVAANLRKASRCPLTISFLDVEYIPLSRSGKHRNLVAQRCTGHA
jgi:phenylacetate-CoA ligase